MQVTQTSAEGLKREFKVVIEAKEIEVKVDARLTELSRTVQLPGFRPGKVPVSLIKTRYGGAVRGEILEDALKHGAEQAISENELRPAVQPKIEVTKFEEGADLEYTMSLEVMPEIEPTDATKLELERLVSEVGDEDVAQALERLAQVIFSLTLPTHNKAPATSSSSSRARRPAATARRLWAARPTSTVHSRSRWQTATRRISATRSTS